MMHPILAKRIHRDSQEPGARVLSVNRTKRDPIGPHGPPPPGYLGGRLTRGGSTKGVVEMMVNAGRTSRNMTATRIQLAATAVAVVFLAVGVLGFIPGITTDFDQMTFAGHESEAQLLGVFQVSVLHNIVHLLFGVGGLALARTVDGARWYLIGGGAVYLILWLYGLLVDESSSANFVPVDDADDWLHLVLGVGMVLLGLVLSRTPAGRARTST
jgi:hypothetical protein